MTPAAFVYEVPAACETRPVFEARLSSKPAEGSLKVAFRPPGFEGVAVLPISGTERVLHAAQCTDLMAAFAIVFRLDHDGLLGADAAPSAPTTRRPSSRSPAAVAPTFKPELRAGLGFVHGLVPGSAPSFALGAAMVRTQASHSRPGWGLRPELGVALGFSLPTEASTAAYRLRAREAHAELSSLPLSLQGGGAWSLDAGAVLRIHAVWAEATGGSTRDSSRLSGNGGIALRASYFPGNGPLGLSLRGTLALPLSRAEYTFEDGRTVIFRESHVHAELSLGAAWRLP